MSALVILGSLLVVLPLNFSAYCSNIVMIRPTYHYHHHRHHFSHRHDVRNINGNRNWAVLTRAGSSVVPCVA